MRPRLIPLTIGAATVLLTLRVVDLWQHAGSAFAQSAKPAVTAPAAAPAALAGTPASAAPLRR